MKTMQINKLKMYKSVLTVCAHHQAIWQENPAFAAAVASFDSKVGIVTNLVNNQLQSSKGVTAAKRHSLNATVDKALVVSNVVGAYALGANKTELLMRNLYSKTEWIKGNAITRVEHLRRLHQDATELIDALTNFGLTQQALDDLMVHILAYEELVKQPRIAIINHKHTTSLIRQEMATIDSIINGQLDRIIYVFKESHPAFFDKFQTARIIIDIKGKRSGFQEPDDGDPIDPQPDDGDM